MIALLSLNVTHLFLRLLAVASEVTLLRQPSNSHAAAEPTSAAHADMAVTTHVGRVAFKIV